MYIIVGTALLVIFISTKVNDPTLNVSKIIYGEPLILDNVLVLHSLQGKQAYNNLVYLTNARVFETIWH